MTAPFSGISNKLIVDHKVNDFPWHRYILARGDAISPGCDVTFFSGTLGERSWEEFRSPRPPPNRTRMAVKGPIHSEPEARLQTKSFSIAQKIHK